MKNLLLGLLLLPTLTLATTGDWQPRQLAKERTGINTFVRQVPNHTLHAFKGTTEVPHPVHHLLAVMADIQRMPDWVFQCHTAALLPQFGDDAAYVHIKGIWPVSDRDAVTRTQLVRAANGALILHTRQATDIDYPTDAVRIPLIDNRFIFEPLADGWTRIIFETQVDPGGKIPGWLANLVATRAPVVTLEGLHRMLQEPQYQLDEAAFRAQYENSPLLDALDLLALPVTDSQ